MSVSMVVVEREDRDLGTNKKSRRGGMLKAFLILDRDRV
jgi:hypothetical protein